MQSIRRFRIPALFCALAVLVCELLARPFTTMGISDDGPYILMAQHLAATGHIVYNGWETALLGSQLYLGAAFIKLFGFSFTTIRMSTLLVAMALAFVLQRILVRFGISERNATLGTLALVLSPLYLLLSVTFMSDIFGLLAIVLCLYGCLRALQASTDRATIAWLCFAVATNALCGTSRQIAWLGTLVMLPSTLWLLRAQRSGLPSQRRVLLAGAAATFAGYLFIFACILWLKHQPYSIPVPLLVSHFPWMHAFGQFAYFLLDIPFLLLPIAALFLPAMRKSRSRVTIALSTAFLGYLLLAALTRHTNSIFRLEPTLGDWVGIFGIYEGTTLVGRSPVFLHAGMHIAFTIASLGGLTGIIALLLRRQPPPPVHSSAHTFWYQLSLLLLPFAIANVVLLIASVGSNYNIFDRYALGLLVVVLACLVRLYQEQVRPQLPLAAIALVAVMALYGIIVTHNLFSFYRARTVLADELYSNGVHDTSFDGGWESNIAIELRHADHINSPRIALPADAYVPTPPLPHGSCPMHWYDYTPHIHPLYTVSLGPNACYGAAPFAPVHYSHWPYRTPGTLYVVRSTPATRQ